MVNEVEVRIETPTPEEHQRLRVIAGMPKRSDSGTVKGLANTLYGVCLYKDDHMVGMGRVVGDGGMVFHLVDIVVEPGVSGARARKIDHGAFDGLDYAGGGRDGYHQSHRRHPGRRTVPSIRLRLFSSGIGRDGIPMEPRLIRYPVILSDIWCVIWN